jgi:hypothetical protein
MPDPAFRGSPLNEEKTGPPNNRHAAKGCEAGCRDHRDRDRR